MLLNRILGICALLTLAVSVSAQEPKFAIMTTQEFNLSQNEKVDFLNFDQEQWAFAEFEEKSSIDKRLYLLSENLLNHKELQLQVKLLETMIGQLSTSPVIDVKSLNPEFRKWIDRKFSQASSSGYSGFENSKFVITPAIEIEFELNGNMMKQLYDLDFKDSKYVSDVQTKLEDIKVKERKKAEIGGNNNDGIMIVPIGYASLEDYDLIQLEVDVLIARRKEQYRKLHDLENQYLEKIKAHFSHINLSAFDQGNIKSLNDLPEGLRNHILLMSRGSLKALGGIGNQDLSNLKINSITMKALARTSVTLDEKREGSTWTRTSAQLRFILGSG